MNKVHVNNEWSPLKEVILGIASDLYFYEPGRIVLKKGFPLWMKLVDSFIGCILKGTKEPEWIRRCFEKEIETFNKILINHGIKVHRPIPVKPLIDDEEKGLSQVFARDPIIIIGDTVIVGKQKLKALRKEIRGFKSILSSLLENKTRIIKIPDEYEDIFLEGGDVIVDLPYVFVGVGENATNLKGAEWLQEQLGKEINVIPVPIIMPGLFHLDTCMTLIGPKMGIICRKALIDPLPFPLNHYDFVEIGIKTRSEIGTNTLMLDSKTIVIQARHKKLKKELEDLGFTVITLNYFWHTLSGGAFRCVTNPICRL